MFREINHIYRRLNIVTDTLLTALTYIVSLYIFGYLYTGKICIPEYIHGNEWLFYPVVILLPVLLNINGLYPTNRLRQFPGTAKIIAHSCFQSFVVLFAILFIFKLHYVSRLWIIEFTILSGIFLIIKEEIVRSYVMTSKRSGANIRNVLMVGEPDNMHYIINKIEKNRSIGLNVIGLLVPAQDSNEKELWGYKVLGSFHEIEDVLHANQIDNVIISTYILPHYEEIENIISRCEEEGVEVWLPTRLFHTKIVKPESDEFLEIPIFVFRTEPKFSWPILIKIVSDRIMGLIFSIITFPIIVVAGIFIKLTSPGPAIFKQKRCGYHGRTFTFYKLRTMYIDAEATKKELAGSNIMSGPIFKVDNDPRITPVGRILRKTSIDELPQFWNIIKGNMSLVGPRPPLPGELADYKGWHRRRLSMKPGITGLLQISGRSEVIDFDKWVALDLEYIDYWSLWLDMKIIFKTIFVVLSTRGAK